MTTRDTDDYKRELFARLPRGAMWPRLGGDATVWEAVLDSIATEFGRIRYDLEAWLEDFFPDQTEQQIEDWERLLGFPDCGLEPGTDDERRGAILAKLRRRGDPTLANIQLLADSFGLNAVVSAGGTADLFFVDSVTEVDSVNLIAGDDATSTVTVTYDAPTSETLECAIYHAVPAHLTLVFVTV